MYIELKQYLKIRYILISVLVMLVLLALWFYLTLPDVSYLTHENPETTALIELRKEQAAADGKKFRLRQKWVSFSAIPDMLKKSVRITEDAAFYKHEGVDWTELKESVKKNWEEGEFARGGSTISQQLAKNLFLSTEKSLFRKFRELFITYRLENELSKNRIFHLYLNIIELGPGVFGVQSASQYYFSKNVNELSLSEIVRLTAVIPKPLSVRADGQSGWLKWKARWILGKLKLYKYISEEQYNETIVEFRKK